MRKYLCLAFSTVITIVKSALVSDVGRVYPEEENSAIASLVSINKHIISASIFMLGIASEGIVLHEMRHETNEEIKAIIPLTYGLLPAALFGLAAAVSQISLTLRGNEDRLLNFYDDLTVSISFIVFNLAMWKNFQNTAGRRTCCKGILSIVLSTLWVIPTWYYAWFATADYFNGSQVPVLLTTATIAVIPLAIDSLISYGLFQIPPQLDCRTVEIENYDQDIPYVAFY